MARPPAELPIVVIPVGTDDAALDACLGALEASTPPGTRVWLADDARVGPRGYAIIERWIAATSLQADYSRRERGIGEVAHLDQALAACGDADVVVLAPDAVPAHGWLDRLAACLGADGAIATATPWCNAGEAAAWPRIGEIAPLPDDLQPLARATAAMPGLCPELPAGVSHAVLIRGSARLRAGGLDATSYGSWYAALIDLSLRLAGLGWRNVLCDTAYVARTVEGVPFEGDMERLAVRWPDWHPRLANFLMHDPLREPRARLGALLAGIGRPDPQRDLFRDRDETGSGAPGTAASSTAASSTAASSTADAAADEEDRR
ncbi:glycosyltransferase family 2 protein [Marilutibacter alkalisoli]|uniref:Glycosyltransferase n=1 Tax=Marilutibacter alkalisoli TaxID=2591633 RepID=A0A514BUB3_9GAMM|nr:glycosyltransferase family 2 protein [Lysobacter alkalisoli]QDH70983.1 glycosyltransferase [Lysobacter alkalisoli]